MNNEVKPKRLAFVIGCDTYESNEIANLKFAKKDANAVYELLIDPQIGNYLAEEEALLIENPVSQEISKKLFNALQNLGKHDSILIYYSGHGLKNQYGDLYLATIDSDPRDALDVCTISGKTLRDYMSKSRSKKICMILDCCYSGAFGDKGATATSMMDVAQDVENNLSGEGRVILMSAHGSQRAKENDEHSHGVFTHYLLEGLKSGAADVNNDGSITPVELHRYIRQRMSEVGGAPQEPLINVSGTGGDFELVASKVQRELWERGINDQIENFIHAKEHCTAIEYLKDKLLATKADAQKSYIQNLLESVENDKEKLRNEFKHDVLEHQVNGDLDAQLANQILARIKRDPDFLFRSKGLSESKEIIRDFFLKDVSAAYLSKSWDEFQVNLERTMPPEIIPNHSESAAADTLKVAGTSISTTVQPQMTRKIYTWWQAHVWVQWVAISVILAISIGGVANYLLVEAYNPSELKVALLVKNKTGHTFEGTKQIMSLFVGKLNSLLEEGAKKYNYPRNYHFSIDDIIIKHTLEELELVLGQNHMDLVGELPAYLVFHIRKEYGMEPFISPKYNNKDTYKAIIFSRNDAPFIDMQSNGGYSKDDAFISMIKMLEREQGKKRLMVADTSSTSGYWYPRWEVLGILNDEVSFNEIALIKGNRDIREEVCEKNSDVIAGVLADFRICKDLENNPDCAELALCPDEKTKLAIIKEIVGIPQGAYVVGKRFYKDLQKNKMLPILRMAWRRAAEILLDESKTVYVVNGESTTIDKATREEYIQGDWTDIKSFDSDYSRTEAAFTAKDKKASKSYRIQRMSLVTAFIILLICAAIYFVIKRSTSDTRAHIKT